MRWGLVSPSLEIFHSSWLWGNESAKAWQVNTYVDRDSYKYKRATIFTTMETEPTTVMPHWGFDLSKTEHLKLQNISLSCDLSVATIYRKLLWFYFFFLWDTNSIKVIIGKTAWQTLLSVYQFLVVPHYDLSSSILGYVAYAFSPLPEATMISTRLRGGEDMENTGGRSLMSNPAVSAVFNT